MKEVIILYVGNSDEYEISEITANSIYQHIDKEKFSAVLVDLNDFKINEIDKQYPIVIEFNPSMRLVPFIKTKKQKMLIDIAKKQKLKI